MALVAVLVGTSARAQDELAAVNQPAPRFRLPLYNPQPDSPAMVGLDRFVGASPEDKGAKLVLLSFMASFCAPCQKELPYLQKLQDQYRADGLRVVSVAIDTDPDGQKKVADLIAKNQVTFPVLKDRFRLVARRWLGSQSPLPSVFLIRADGTITSLHRGYDEKTTQALASEVQAALGIAPKPTPSHPAKRRRVRQGRHWSAAPTVQ
jgi:thiol-disulfide isomerase/thioredoxin